MVMLKNFGCDVVQGYVYSKPIMVSDFIDFMDTYMYGEVKENNVLKITYYYDEFDQLIRENNKYLNNGSGYTITYSYDDVTLIPAYS